MASNNNVLDHAADRVFSVIGAFYLSQMPRFMEQYMALLAKIISGKQIIQAAVKKDADASVITSLLSFLKDYGVDLSLKRNFASQAEKISFYQESLTQWKQVSELEKPFIFLSRIDFDVVKALDYTAVLQKDTKSLLYAFAGIFIGALAYKLIIKAPFYLFFAKERKRTDYGKGKNPRG